MLNPHGLEEILDASLRADQHTTELRHALLGTPTQRLAEKQTAMNVHPVVNSSTFLAHIVPIT